VRRTDIVAGLKSCKKFAIGILVNAKADESMTGMAAAPVKGRF
jgi:hypothetical protein